MNTFLQQIAALKHAAVEIGERAALQEFEAGYRQTCLMAETFCIKQHKLTIATMPYEATALQLSEVSREGFRSDVELPGYNLVAGGQAQPGSALLDMHVQR